MIKAHRMRKILAAASIFLFSLSMLPASTLQEIPFETMDGKTSKLGDYSGKVLLVVNVASKCGLTPQYAALETLQQKYGPEGFTILGFPCNDFAGQEPGTNEEIVSFCSTRYNVTFPILAKVHVLGAEKAPLFAALTGPDAKFPGDIAWNFGKFLIGRNGEVIARFEPKTKPDDQAVISAVEAALK
ncbi:glutathione peroxidase [Terrimicrobium sacchariphilum]|jgi:glutathione peroxidase|uniref:Glutathione peroxidase n=2 Tax=Terrimicrobium sacchariphilum TaxID=690879 RepID=A0A146G920_TERSA|nr:glutathione peroxidase [Terrimicrobium sacchariphilum]